LGSAGANPSTLVFNAGVAGAFDGLIPGSNAARACWISAFTLNDPARLQQASVYIGGTSDKTTGSQTGLDNWTGQVLYRFYADDSNKPGAVISQGSANSSSCSRRAWSGLSGPATRSSGCCQRREAR
jgi:hypothetical protein